MAKSTKKVEVFTTGYPKSGNTWLDNLLGDMFKCKVTDVNNNVGQDFGKGNYQVIKLHMPYDKSLRAYDIYDDKVRDRCKKGKLIFICRDPRSVIASAMHYRKQTDIIAAINHMCKAHEAGGTKYEAWVNSYIESPDNCDFIVKYEDLHANTVEMLQVLHKMITGKTKAKRTAEAIAKRNDIKKWQKEDPHFFWKGQTDSWKEVFTQEAGKLLNETLGDFMLKNGYIDKIEWYNDLPA